MYENIKYEELKQLPDDQKKEALQELMNLHGSNSAIAKAIEGFPVAIANMYSKFVEGKQIGRKKGSKNAVKEVVQQPTEEIHIVETPIIIPETKPKRTYNRKQKEVSTIQQDSQESQDITQLPSASFTTSLSGELTGDQIKQRVTGMINSLLDDNQYTINIQIDEK